MRFKGLIRTVSALVVIAMVLGVLPALAAPADRLTENYKILPQYVKARSFSDGMAAVFDGSKWGYIDTTGRLVIECTWDYACDFNEGYAAVAETGGSLQTRYIINRKGTVVADLGDVDADSLDISVSSGTFISAGRMYSLRQGTVLPINGFSSALVYNEGYAVVSTDTTGSFTFPESMEKYLPVLGYMGGDMLVDLSGKVVWNPDWGACLSYEHSMVPVQSRQNGLWGFANDKGQYVIAPMFEDLWYTFENGVTKVFHDGYASVVKKGVCMVIDMEGYVVTTVDADSLGVFSEGLLPIEVNGLWGYADINGEVLITPEYRSAEPFSEGVALVSTAPDYYYFIDRQGNRVNAVAYEYAEPVSDGLALISIGGKYGYVAFDGRAVNSATEVIAFWAEPELSDAYDYGLLPNGLACMYKNAINRAEFTSIAIRLIESALGKSIDEVVLEKTGKSLDSFVQSYPFPDTNDRDIMAAYALGIVIGVGDAKGSFMPYRTLQRQEAAKMLTVSAKIVGIENTATPIAFEDASVFQAWSVEYIDFVSALEIMKGVDAYRQVFDPFGVYSREQAFATMQRIYKMAN
ncbi:MAG: WG repeat-containing protein [Clostridia bacterium]|nr:WG repeat-containing protein [Clostridia bacterium]